MASREATKAAKIRYRMKQGEKVSARSREFLAGYEKTKGKSGPKPKPGSKAAARRGPTLADAANADPLPTDEQRAADPAPEPELGQVAADDGPTGRPVPDPPPAVIGRGTSRGAGDGWRDRYRKETGREQTCVEAAQLLCFALKKMNAQIRADGAVPWCDDSMIDATIFPSAVLSVDMLLPPGFELKPEIATVVGATVVTTQRLVVGRRAAKARAKAKTDARPPREEPEPERRKAGPTIVVEAAPVDIDPPKKASAGGDARLVKLMKDDPDAMY